MHRHVSSRGTDLDSAEPFAEGDIQADVRREWVVVRAHRRRESIGLILMGGIGVVVLLGLSPPWFGRIFLFFWVAGLWGLAAWLLAYRRTVIVDATAGHVDLYHRRRLVRRVALDEVVEVGHGMRHESRGRYGQQVAVYFVRLALPGEELELMAKDREASPVREVAGAIADAAGKPLREL